MVESSSFWDGTTLGDAAGATPNAPYSSQEFANWVINGFAQNNASPWQRSFVSFAGVQGFNSLLVSGVATPLAIASGVAVVAGYSYYNDGAPALTLAIGTPGANPRIDRVVLRVSWAAQTVRVALLAGVEAATPSPPALTQTFGTTWEVSLAQAYITTGGVVTIRDERVGNLGLGNSVLFRDIAAREYEEFFDHMESASPTAAGTPTGWSSTLAGTGATTMPTGVPTSVLISTGATNGGTNNFTRGRASAGVNDRYRSSLNQAPMLFEARAQIVNAVDANGIIVMRLIDSAGTSYVEFGMRGSVSTANLMGRNAAGGAATSFTTGQAVDTTAYHTYGIYVPVTAGPAVFMYDRVPIGQVITAIPAGGTAMRPEFFVDNGATSAVRSLSIDWARHVRGTAG